MVQAWIKPIEAAQVVERTVYFLALRPRTTMQSYSLYGTNIKGRSIITCKPGIANRVYGNEKLRELLRNNPDHVALEVPADADKRWHRRSRRIR
ncbi:MAG: hypothetical protein Q7S87_08555 [Agitococcus sp.]|nr:hypothetical protein [Agitococcus sp.]MDO9177620.1 hypothetical protein [Agitococcus sp.]